MSATIHQLKPAPVLRASCTRCGTEATCDCNAPYVPARERAAAAIVATPEKSNRAIAAEIGVSDKTVAAARAERSAPAPKKVTGLDGKQYTSMKRALATFDVDDDRILIEGRQPGERYPSVQDWLKKIDSQVRGHHATWHHLTPKQKHRAAPTIWSACAILAAMLDEVKS